MCVCMRTECVKRLATSFEVCFVSFKIRPIWICVCASESLLRSIMLIADLRCASMNDIAGFFFLFFFFVFDVLVMQLM